MQQAMLIEPPEPGLRHRIVRDEQVPFTKVLAQRYLKLPVFPGERNVSRPHVQYLRTEMQADNFNPIQVVMATATCYGVEYKINSQHISEARLEMPDDWCPLIRVVHHEVENAEQLRRLYASYDRGKPRTDAHLVKTMLVDRDETRNIPPSVLARVVPGFKLWKWETSVKNTPAQIADVILDEHAETFKRVCEFCRAHDAATLHMVRRSPVIAALFETFAKHHDVAADFWVPVLAGLNLPSSGDPRFRLRELLQSCTLHGSVRAVSGRKPIDAEEMYRICVNAWNRWRRGEQNVSILRVTTRRQSAH